MAVSYMGKTKTYCHERYMEYSKDYYWNNIRNYYKYCNNMVNNVYNIFNNYLKPLTLTRGLGLFL